MQVVKLLSEKECKELEELCGRCLADELFTMIPFHNGNKVRRSCLPLCRPDPVSLLLAPPPPPPSCLCVPLACLQVFVATGDIASMWIRDSAVQLGTIVPRMTHQPALRLLVEGAVRTQASGWCRLYVSALSALPPSSLGA